MKKVEAIVRKSKFDAVQEALYGADIQFLTYWDVRGVGKDVQHRSYRGVEYDTSAIERTFITFFCQDKNVEPAVKAIIESGQTGKVGDGKIFISDVEKAIKIRTSEEGVDALN